MDTRYYDHHHYNNNVQGILCDTETELNTGEEEESGVGLAESTDNGYAQWDRLPPEILTTIFSNLTMSETELAENTCVSWMRSCNDPCLWRRMEFYFDGSDSLRLVANAFRIIASKGHFLRDLVVRIGNPRLNQAWLMSECIQQLFDFISQHSSSTCYIESFTIHNLVIFTQNRFFRLSKESTLGSLNNFLLSQKNLKCVNFTSCRFNPAEGIRLIRALKCSGFKNNLRKLDLHNFFKRRFRTARSGFKTISRFPALEEICADANDIDETVLSWLTIQRPQKNRLRHLKLYFEALKPPRGISRECWMAARQACPEGLQVSFHFCGWLDKEWLNPLLSDAIPLVNCYICWKRVHRGPWTFHTDLNFLLEKLATHNSSLLEKFTLTSDIRALPEHEDALVRLVTACPRLTEFNVLMRLSEAAIATITAMLRQRRYQVVKCQFLPVQRSQTNILTGSRLRPRGC